jgi:hypothetical protein
MLQFTSAVATVIACVLPTVAIAILSKMHSMPEILGFIGLFTTLFAVGLMLLTDAGTSRVEIFTATAASVRTYLSDSRGYANKFVDSQP